MVEMMSFVVGSKHHFPNRVVLISIEKYYEELILKYCNHGFIFYTPTTSRFGSLDNRIDYW